MTDPRIAYPVRALGVCVIDAMDYVVATQGQHDASAEWLARTLNAQAALRWTTEQPKKPGRYWAFSRDGAVSLVSLTGDKTCWCVWEFCAPEEFDPAYYSHWSGPLTPPPEPER